MSSYTTRATIRDYDGATDTASVELAGIGIIDAWIDGITIATPIDRHQLVSGVGCTLEMPDAHRICEATVVSIDATPAGAAGRLSSPVGAALPQSGRGFVSTDAFGAGSTVVTYPVAYSGTPSFFARAEAGACTVSAVGALGSTVNLTGAPVSTTVYFSWSSQGPA